LVPTGLVLESYLNLLYRNCNLKILFSCVLFYLYDGWCKSNKYQGSKAERGFKKEELDNFSSIKVYLYNRDRKKGPVTSN